MRSIEAEFGTYCNNHLTTTDLWVTYEFPENIKKIEDLFESMKDLVTPFPVPINPDDPSVQRRRAAGKKLPCDETYRALNQISHSPVRKLTAILGKLQLNYKKAIEDEARLRDLRWDDRTGKFYRVITQGATTQYIATTLALSDEMEERQKWVIKTLKTLTELNSKINKYLF